MTYFKHKIGVYFGRKAPLGDIGLEVEVEFPEGTIAQPIVSKNFWTTKPDGSLRNGLEYVLRAPIKATELSAAVADFEAGTKGYQFIDSQRTSVHCHINVNQMTFDDLTRILTAYYAFENVFVAANDPSRAGNLFCLRGKDAEWQINEIIRCVRHGWNVDYPWIENARYSALNMCAPRTFGSLEYRFIEGTTDPKVIEFWAQTMYDFTVNTSKFDIEEQVKLVTSGRNGQIDFLNKVLTRPNELFDKLPENWTDLVEENVPYTTAFRQAYTKGKRLEAPKTVTFLKPYILNSHSDDLITSEKPKKKSKVQELEEEMMNLERTRWNLDARQNPIEAWVRQHPLPPLDGVFE